MKSCFCCVRKEEEEEIEEASLGRAKNRTVLCEEALVSGWLFGWVGHAEPLQFYHVPTIVLYCIRAASHPCADIQSPLKSHIVLIQELRYAHEFEKSRLVR